MLYSYFIKKVVRQSFDHVNNQRWDELRNPVAPNVHHRFAGAHSIGGERHDKDHAPLAGAPRPRPAQPPYQGQQHLSERLALAHYRVCAVGRHSDPAQWRRFIL
jgi:hypothetical protein